MRIFQTTILFATLLISVIMLPACKKTDDAQPISALNVVNAFSGSTSIDFYLDSKRVNTSPLDYKVSTGYFNIYPGQRSVRVVNGENSSHTLGRATVSFPEGHYISLFIAPKLETNADSATYVVSVDSLVQPEAGKASIRFVNLTPGSRKLDVLMKGSGNVLFSNQAFKGVSKFISINAANDVVLQLREAGMDGVPKLELASFNLQAGKIYTVFSTGLWDGTGTTAFGAKVWMNYN